MTETRPRNRSGERESVRPRKTPVDDASGSPGRTRFILLGASNLTIGFPLIVENLRRATNSHCEIFAAHGFGRSYGSWSRFLFRTLPGIRDCGIWDAVNHSSDGGNPLALVTDIGNDLLYGHSVDQIVAWVTESIDRLQKLGAEIVVTPPPLESVGSISRARYWLARTILFPGCRLQFADVLQAAEELTERIAQIGNDRKLHVVPLPQDWYGLDPIHIRRRQRLDAWRTILSRWNGIEFPAEWKRPARATRKLARRAQPLLRHVRRKERHTAQPAIKIDDFTVSLY